MVSAEAVAGVEPRTRMTTVAALLALAVFINYVDRGNLATAAPLIKDELKLSGTQLGILLSAFFWTYVPAQMLAGWLSERINAYSTLAAGLFLWSLATIASGFATGFAALIAFRLLLGLGESAAFPCSSCLLARHLPDHRRGSANGLIAAGLALGPAFGTLTGGLLMADYGWRAVFVVFGACSLLWLWPWFSVTGGEHDTAKKKTVDTSPSFLAILGLREAWGASLGHFTSNYSFYFVITWLPLYLVKFRGFSVAEMSALGGLIYLVYAASALASGWLSDRWMGAGASANRVRKTAMITAQAGVALAMAGCAVGNSTFSIACLFLAGLSFGPGTSNIYAVAQTLAGPKAAGKWVGIQNCVGNLAGIVAPIVTGFVVDRTGEFYWAFVVAGLIAVVGMICWGIVIRRVEPIDWEHA